jgi:transcriptional regulator with XRE-family HTH domain
MAFNGEHFDKAAYVARLRLLRRALGMNQAQFTAFVGIGYKKWNHYERGYALSRETAFLLHDKLRDVLPVTIDWLWWGDTRGLAQGTIEQLNALREHKGKSLQGKSPRGPARPTKPRRISKKDRTRRPA